MICQTCGLQSTAGLAFCKRCGAQLYPPPASPESSTRPAKVTGMFWAIALFGLGSISVLLGTMIALAAMRASDDVTVPTVIFGTASIIIIAWLLIRQLGRYINLSQGIIEPEKRGKSHKQAAEPYPQIPYQSPQLDAPPRAVSVTEHTTRNFDPLPAEQWQERERLR